jgi:hypothetical protein
MELGVIFESAAQKFQVASPPVCPPPVFKEVFGIFWFFFGSFGLQKKKREGKERLHQPTMSTKLDAPQQFKQPSRKGKKAWRKNVDVTEVQEGLRLLKDEEIKGYVD